MTRWALAIALLVLSARTAVAKDGFPMAAGDEWVYRGTLTRDAHAPGCEGSECKVVVTRTALRWTMKVTAVSSVDDLRTALLAGYPGDLIWLQGEPRPGAWLIVRDKAGRYFLLDEVNSEPLADIMNDPDKLKSRLDESKVILQWPFPDNKRFGCDPEISDPSQPSRNCWRVAGSHHSDTSRIRGAPASAASTTYDLEYRTTPEDLAVSFVPNLGFTHYAFHHHGSAYDLDLRLVQVTLQRERP